MKKSMQVIVLGFTLFLSSLPAWSQAAREATIEPETKARIILQSRLSSKLSEVGDRITAVLDEPIYVDGKMVMGRGTEFVGRVTAVRPAKRPLKSAQMMIAFERVVMPWGEEPVSIVVTAIDDWETDTKYKANDEGKVSGGKDGKKTAENVALGGTIGGAGAGTVLLSGGGGAAGAATLGGGLLAGLLLTKGKEVRVEPGAVFRIQFVKPLTLPVIGQPGPRRPIDQEDAPSDNRPPEKNN
ncbi:MAG TPA: hypothetical protein VNO70_12725 [Blastocatellia bacterium]|nr:hypothetical protein [Blastocatellia bacterium]